MDKNKPLLMERPQRGREMVSKQVPAGLVGEGQKTALMHEGYVGDTKFMVPDSNLQVMKELVDYRLGASGTGKPRPTLQAELVNVRYSEKTERMKSKLEDDFSTDDSSTSSTDSDDTSRLEPISKAPSPDSTADETDDDDDAASTSDYSSRKGDKESTGTSKSPMESKSTLSSATGSKGTSQATKPSRKSIESSISAGEISTGTSKSSIESGATLSSVTGSEGTSQASKPSGRSTEPSTSAGGKSKGISKSPNESKATLSSAPGSKGTSQASKPSGRSTEPSTSAGGKSTGISKSPDESKAPLSSVPGSKGTSQGSKPSGRSNYPSVSTGGKPRTSEEESTLSSAKKYKEGRDSRGSTGSPKFLTSRQPSDPSKRSRGSASERSSRALEDDPWGPNSGAYRGGTEPFIDEALFGYQGSPEKIRFLISGHIKKDPLNPPIFIFHKFDGSSPFKDEIPDFSTNKTTGDLTLGVTGKFYKDSILEEVYNVPKSLKIRPQRMPIDSRSKVCEGRFSETIRIGDYYVKTDGEFIKQRASGKFTPLITFKIRNNLSSETDLTSESENVISNISPLKVYIADSGNSSPFKNKLIGSSKHSNTFSHQDKSMPAATAEDSNLVCKDKCSYTISKFRKNEHRPEDLRDAQEPNSGVVYRFKNPKQRKQSGHKENEGVLKRISKMFSLDLETK